MAKRAGTGQRLWWHGRDISGDIGRLNSLASPRGVVEAPGLNATGMERFLTHGDGLIDCSGWFDDATDAEHDAFSGLPATDVVTLLAISTTRGDPAAALVAKHVTHTHDRTQDGALAIGAVAQANGSPLEWGKMLTAGAETIASANSTTSLDENGASGSSAFGAVAYLEYESLGSGTPTILIEDSANDSTWATLMTFTGGTPPIGERLTVTGNVDRYLRVTLTGTFTNAKIAVMFRRGTSVDDVSLA